MFYSFRNARIQLDGSDIYASNVNINCANTLAPSLLVDQNQPYANLVLSGPQTNICVINYYLTGQDKLRLKFGKDGEFITGWLNGLIFHSGVIKNYTLNIKPNEPVNITAELAFYDTLKGTFTPSKPPAVSVPFLNGRFSFISGVEGRILDFNNSLSLTYTANQDVAPLYLVGQGYGKEILPNRVTMLKSESSLQITFDNLSGDFSVSGEKLFVNVSLKNNLNTTDVFSVSGIVTKNETIASVGEVVTRNITITQPSIFNPPIISSFSPTGIFLGMPFTIYGSNLLTTRSIFVGNIPHTFKIISDNEILAKALRPMAKGGKITINTLGGSFTTSTNLDIFRNTTIRFSVVGGGPAAQGIYGPEPPDSMINTW
jgi:hypothetical protein